MVRHRVFLSYHGDDKEAVDAFVNQFDDLEDSFIDLGILMPDEIVDSDDDDYVMRRIREEFLEDTTVTMVVIDDCTWSRQFVDWEVQASLRQSADGKPNGLLTILLEPGATEGKLPPRVRTNVDSGCAYFYARPSTGSNLNAWIEDAYDARESRPDLIDNGATRKRGDDACE